ncbi:hypothetical protein SAY86_000668 [Trapa natans]|uniref:Uncharacterized protein n=1 Tax=Trapa natans TaxID=22666 RepID=A0AAN7MUS4_TRANT|nr:hypothetical protein SAY86_000668 [Trapa natans]
MKALVVPEFVGQGVLGLLYLFTGHWFMALLCSPCTYYNFRLYSRGKHEIDVTEAYNILQSEKRQRLFKLGYIIFLLVLSVFWLAYTAWEDIE